MGVGSHPQFYFTCFNYVRGSSLRKGGAGAAGRRPPLWGSAAAEYGCLMTGQENERGAPRHL